MRFQVDEGIRNLSPSWLAKALWDTEEDDVIAMIDGRTECQLNERAKLICDALNEIEALREEVQAWRRAHPDTHPQVMKMLHRPPSEKMEGR